MGGSFTATTDSPQWIVLPAQPIGGIPGDLPVQVNPSGLPAGTYNGKVMITVGAITQNVAVQLVVSASPVLWPKTTNSGGIGALHVTGLRRHPNFAEFVPHRERWILARTLGGLVSQLAQHCAQREHPHHYAQRIGDGSRGAFRQRSDCGLGRGQQPGVDSGGAGGKRRRRARLGWCSTPPR